MGGASRQSSERRRRRRRAWRSHAPPGDVTRPPATRKESAAEQDRAAGGRESRKIALADTRTATASVRLVAPRGSRRVYAYLHYAADGKNVTRYIGDATADTRQEALRLAWRLARRRNML